MSAYQQWDMSLGEALVNEGCSAKTVVGLESLAGAAQFAAGAGRHGKFN